MHSHTHMHIAHTHSHTRAYSTQTHTHIHIAQTHTHTDTHACSTHTHTHTHKHTQVCCKHVSSLLSLRVVCGFSKSSKKFQNICTGLHTDAHTHTHTHTHLHTHTRTREPTRFGSVCMWWPTSGAVFSGEGGRSVWVQWFFPNQHCYRLL